MVLAAAGLITQRGLIRQWRIAVVAIFLAAAIATPTGDALTMTVLATPMLILYIISIALVGMAERAGKRAQQRAEAAQPLPEQATTDDPYAGLPKPDQLPPAEEEVDEGSDG